VKLSNYGKGIDMAIRSLNDLRGVGESLSDDSPDTAMYNCLARRYADWVHRFQCSPFPEKSFVAWVMHLTVQGILKEEVISSFLYQSMHILYHELVVDGERVSTCGRTVLLDRIDD